MSANRHEPYDELISASLTGDLTAEERPRLDAHLDGCADCRATLAAFADQRRIVAGLRHVAPPRDLAARVRAGIEGGSPVGLPWWRRPAVVFAGIGGGLAAVAGALLALVLLNGTPEAPQVGNASPTPSAPVSTPSPPPPSADAPAPTATPVEATPSAAPTVAATPSATPIPASPEPDLLLALTGELDNQVITVRSDADTTLMEVDLPASGPPIAAELSPDGQWLAHIVEVGQSGLNEGRATRVAEPGAAVDEDAPPPVDSDTPVGRSIALGQSVAGSPFLEQLFWSESGRYLAYTLADGEADTTDVWIFEPATGERYQLTDVGAAYAGSWVPGSQAGDLLWVSVAGEEPKSYLQLFGDGERPESADPSAGDVSTADAFQPMVSPNGSFVIFWTGRMAKSGAEWTFAEGGRPWLAENRPSGDAGYSFQGPRELFTDLTIGREAFTSAAIAWGRDSDALAVWETRWTGISQDPAGGEYPDPARVYFGYASDPRHLTRTHAIDLADIPAEAYVVDVKVPATGRHLVVTAAYPRAGELDPPRADLLLITRNTGDVPDVVEPLEDDEAGWYGPAAIDDVYVSGAP